MNSNEILNYLKIKEYLITLEEYLNLIENPQVREVYYKDDKYNLITDDNYKFTFKIIEDESR